MSERKKERKKDRHIDSKERNSYRVCGGTKRQRRHWEDPSDWDMWAIEEEMFQRYSSDRRGPSTFDWSHRDKRSLQEWENTWLLEWVWRTPRDGRENVGRAYRRTKKRGTGKTVPLLHINDIEDNFSPCAKEAHQRLRRYLDDRFYSWNRSTVS